jgi:hypothetical protein
MRTYRRRVENLSRTEAIAIVREVRAILFPRSDVAEQWAPEHLDWLSGVFLEHGLGPTDEAMLRAEEG